METVCERNPPVTGGFRSQRASNSGFHVSFDVSLNTGVNQTVESPVIWDAMILIVTSV